MNARLRPPCSWISCLSAVLGLATAARADDEARIFTPPGFNQPGAAVTLPTDHPRQLELRVIDDSTRKPTPCRVNVVGPDGQFYQPPENRLSPFSLTGDWPKTGKGNRVGKGPFRYFGRFFYITGETRLAVPEGKVRVEVWKGLEYQPASIAIDIPPSGREKLEIRLHRVVDLPSLGYESGDPHLHFPRTQASDDTLILDLLEAEDVRYGTPLGYNEPAGPYTGVREKLDTPQLRGLGTGSEHTRGAYHILSGQEYRSSTYGHLNLFLRDDLVREGESLNANNWPPYGLVGRETRAKGGVAIHAHGGYAQSIYADFVQGDVDAVELLQFAVYRGIELADWYHMLNIGYRFPCVGASDFPACRKLSDCRTYVKTGDGPRDTTAWLKGASAGRSFVTTGPLLLLTVDGHDPGDVIAKQGAGPHRLQARLRLATPTAPVQSLQWIVNGAVVEQREWTDNAGKGGWIEIERTFEISASSWIAARVFGASPEGQPDADAHTNPIHVHVDGKAPYDRSSLDILLAKLDGQMKIHRARAFPEKARVLDYFQKSRDILLKIRSQGGLPTAGVPAEWRKDETSAFDPSARTHTEAELAEFLKPLPPLPPSEAIKTIETLKGDSLQLVASEPMIRSPVAAAYDENGDLYVAEMTDYPYKPRPGQAPLGSIRWLRDADGDGRMDESRVFADGLLWAAGIAPWKGGVYVASPPDIWYLKDTDGDHVADVRRKVFTGFGTENEQGMLNNLTFGLDHRIYGSTSTNGGSVRQPDQPESAGVSVRGRDFRFDPVSEVLEPITGTVQFGTTFDDLGNRFLCSESRPLMQAVLPLDAMARNPFLPIPTGLENVAGGPVPIFRISPVERWRQIRSSRRIAHGERSAESAGASHHVVDAAAGVTIYRGNALPSEVYGDAFVCDAQNNLVHHMKLTPRGVTFQAKRAEAATEFIRSHDNWFRPVNLVNAPDGTLQILDMSRETIEAIHIPLDVVKHLDLRRGREQGRIYRVVPTGFTPPVIPRLGQATTEQLVALLKHPNGWHRDTAHRLLFERQDHAAVEPLRTLLRSDAPARSRVLVLWSLHGLNALTKADLLVGLADSDEAVAEHAIRLAAERIDAPEVFTAVLRHANASPPRLRFATALTLGAASDARVPSALATIILVDPTDRWIVLAALTSATKAPDRMLAELIREPRILSRPEGLAVLETLAAVIGSQRSPAGFERAAALIDAQQDEALKGRLLRALGNGLAQTGAHFGRESIDVQNFSGLARLIARASAVAADPKQPEAARVDSVRLIAMTPIDSSHDILGGLLQSPAPSSVQVAVIRGLSTYNDPRAGDLILRHLPSLSPAPRTEAIAALLSREPWTLRLLRTIQENPDVRSEIEPARREGLRSHANPEIARLAREWLQNPQGSSVNLDARLQAVRQLSGNADAGLKVFEANCQSCHRIEQRGHAVGPDLTATQFQEPEALLTHILEPNRYVAPNYVQYLVSDQSGRIFTGLIASETASSLTLRRTEGVEDTILRNQIEEMRSTGKSLMPDDVAARLTDAQLADLAAFLLRSRTAHPDAERLEIGTLPGLVEPESTRSQP